MRHDMSITVLLQRAFKGFEVVWGDDICERDLSLRRSRWSHNRPLFAYLALLKINLNIGRNITFHTSNCVICSYEKKDGIKFAFVRLLNLTFEVQSDVGPSSSSAPSSSSLQLIGLPSRDAWVPPSLPLFPSRFLLRKLSRLRWKVAKSCYVLN